MLLVTLLVLYATIFQATAAASTSVTTSIVVSIITSKIVSTSSSVIGTSTSTSSFDSCSTTTDSDGNSSSSCKGGQALVLSTVYSSELVTLTSVYETTVGYSIVYGSIKDETHSQAGSNSVLEVSTTAILATSAVTSHASSTTSTAPSSETRTGSTTSRGSSSTITAKSSQSIAVSGSETSTADLAQSSTAADDGQLMNSAGLKVLVIIVVLASLGLACGVALLIVKRRRARKVQQGLLGTKTTKDDIEKTETQGLIDSSNAEVMHEKATLNIVPPRSASSTSSLCGISSFEMSTDTKPFYAAQATQKYGLMATTTAVYELDSGDYEFRDAKR